MKNKVFFREGLLMAIFPKIHQNNSVTRNIISKIIVIHV